MKFGWLTLSLSPSPAEDAARIDQLLDLAGELAQEFVHLALDLRIVKDRQFDLDVARHEQKCAR